MRNKFFMACVAVIVFSIMLCTLIDCNTANESTDRLEKAIKEEEDSGGDTTIINNYNDNSTTINNNTTNNYYNTDTDEEEDDYEEEVYETEETVVDDKSDKEDYKEYNNSNDYNNNTESNSSNNDDDTITPIGDIKNDMNPDPDVVHIKNIKCPNCGAYSYIEHYNLNDEDLLFYMGTCKSCGYERQ